MGLNCWTRDNLILLLFRFVLFDSICPVNNFSVMSGRVFLCWTSTNQGLMRLCQKTQRSDAGDAPTSKPLGLESSTLPLRSLILLQANNKGMNQPVHLRSLISFFVVCYLEGRITILAKGKHSNVLASVCSWAGWFVSYLVRNHADRFSRLQT